MKRILFGLVGMLLAGAVMAQARPRIDKAADLPTFTYAVSGNLENLVRDDKAFAPFAAQFRRDIEGVLAKYDIADKSMQGQLLGSLLQLDLLEGKNDLALKRIEAIRAVQEKPADKLLAGMLPKAIVQARQGAGSADSVAYRQEVGRRLGQFLQDLPFNVISNDIKSAKGRSETMGETLMLGQVREVLQPVVDKAGSLSSELAPVLVGARFGLLVRLPLKQTLIDTYGAYLKTHTVEKADIWAARSVRLAAEAALTPVTIAVWDGGVDSKVFGQSVVRDAAGKPLVVGFDKYSNPAHFELQPVPANMQERLPKMNAKAKGFSDLQSNIDSPEASQVKQLLSTLKADAYKSEIEALNFAGNYSHGTHVAGIAMDSNAMARLVIGRIEFGHTLQPDPCPSRVQAEKDAAAQIATVEFFKKQGVRVVNMSWGGSVSSIEDDLEKCGIGKTPEERKALAREYFDLSKNALTKAFAGAPDILFITAAGNSNQDASFAEDAPADIVLPNLLTVGAVDKAGDEAAFTSYGPTVRIHANGYLVESYLPGGDRVAYSGTSMASPQVANLAGKMLAINPRLKPTEVIDIIIATADKTPDGRRTLMHPAKAVAAVRSKL